MNLTNRQWALTCCDDNSIRVHDDSKDILDAAVAGLVSDANAMKIYVYFFSARFSRRD